MNQGRWLQGVFQAFACHQTASSCPEFGVEHVYEIRLNRVVGGEARIKVQQELGDIRPLIGHHKRYYTFVRVRRLVTAMLV